MQNLFSVRYLIFLVAGGLLFAPLYLWFFMVAKSGLFSVSTIQFFGFSGILLCCVILYEVTQRLFNHNYVKKYRLSRIDSTGQHTLIVMAISLATRFNITIPGLVVRQSDDCNAMLVPLFKNNALFINHKLIDALTPDELKAVVAHEYGHIALGHVHTMSWLNSLLQVCLVLPLRLIVFVLHPVSRIFKADKKVMLLVKIILIVAYAGPLLIFVNALNRQFEKDADIEAVKYVSADLLIKALKTLHVHRNESFPSRFRFIQTTGLSSQSFGYRLLQYFKSHPSINNRIEMLQAKD